MVKKKGKSKRITLKDKYKIQRRVTETGRKRKKQAKRDAKAGIVHYDKKKNKDPGIPNSWPFKQDLLKDIQRARERQQQLNQEKKAEKRKAASQRKGDDDEVEMQTEQTVQDLMNKASQDQAKFAARSVDVEEDKQRSDGTKAVGQASRRAYLRELKKVVDTADVLLQVLDARDPLGSRINRSIEEAILSRADKRMVLVLNKIDLVPKEVVSNWLTFLRRSHPAIAIKATRDANNSSFAMDATEDTTAPVGMDGLLQLLKNYARTGTGKSKTTIVVGIIGFPNVGKSSIINALKRCRAVGVSPRPGFTTSMQEVVLDKNVRLLDSPGVVFSDDETAMLGNCLDASSINDPIPAVTAILERCNLTSLIMTYNIPAFPPGDVMMFLAMVARSQGRVLKGGIPNKIAAARSVLRDWNSGKIPYYTVPPKDAPTSKHADATVVTKFAKEFGALDQEVLGSLKDDKDEMDFVQMSTAAAPTKMTEGETRAAKFLSSSQGSDDEDEEMVEALPAPNLNRAQLANAEDYDFDDL